VAANGPTQLTVEPFDKAVIKDIEAAIAQSNLNLTPMNDGSGTIRINVSIVSIDMLSHSIKGYR
jgi:ribosome recycling factor